MQFKQALLILHEICYSIVDVCSILGVHVCSIWVYIECQYGGVEPLSSACYIRNNPEAEFPSC